MFITASKDAMSLQFSGSQAATDLALLQAFCAGDEVALCRLHSRYAGSLLALARRDGLVDPEGALEDVFVALSCRASCFERSGLSLPVWIVGMATWHYRTCPRLPDATSVQ